jgi:hypothetical protein
MDESTGLDLPADAATVEPVAGGPRLARSLLLRLLACLTLAGVADWLFYHEPFGWAAGLFALLVAVAIIGFRPCMLKRRSVQVVFALEAGLALALVIEPLPHTVFMAVAGLVGLALVSRQGFTTSIVVWIQRYVAFGALGAAQPFRDAVSIAQRGSRHGTRRGTASLARWILPLVLGGVFVVLFAAANPIIGSWLDTFTQTLRDALNALDMLRVGFWCVMAWAAWALIRTRTPSFARAARPPAVRAVLSTGTLVRCLVVFNLLFVVQNALDLRYLLLGATLPDGMTYAQYAHRGAYPLVFTALLAAGFVLITFRAGVDKEGSAWARRLVYLWLGQNVLLALAAATRLALYVEVYTLTRLRLAAAIWMGLIAVGLVLIAVRVLTGQTNRRLVWANAVAAFVVVYALCFVDVDRFIANYNVAHSAEVAEQAEPIDVDYLGRLGASALPAWRWLAKHASDPTVRKAAIVRVSAEEARLEADLATWRGWTLRRQSLLHATDSP